MITRSRVRAAALAAALLAPGVVAARVVDYGVDDAAQAALTSEAGLQPLSPAPGVGPYDVLLTVAEGVDHVSLALGQACSAYKVENPISLIARRILAEWDRDHDVTTASGTAPRLALTITRGRSDRRCVQLAEMRSVCYVHAQLSGEAVLAATDGSQRRFPVSGDVERKAAFGGFCGNMAGSIGIVSREAAIALVADAVRKAEASTTS